MGRKADTRKHLKFGDIALIPLGLEAKDGFAFVDMEYSWLDAYFWTLGSHGYPIANIAEKSGRKVKKMHKLITRTGADSLIDHINQDKKDNRLSNLRKTSKSVNLLNSKIERKNSSGIKGVRWVKAKKKWEANIKYMGVSYYLGQFPEKEKQKAAQSREKAEEELIAHLVKGTIDENTSSFLIKEILQKVRVYND